MFRHRKGGSSNPVLCAYPSKVHVFNVFVNLKHLVPGLITNLRLPIRHYRMRLLNGLHNNQSQQGTPLHWDRQLITVTQTLLYCTLEALAIQFLHFLST